MALLNRSRQALLVLSVALVALVVGSAGADGAPSAKNDCASQAWRVANSGPTLAYGAVIVYHNACDVHAVQIRAFQPGGSYEYALRRQVNPTSGATNTTSWRSGLSWSTRACSGTKPVVSSIPVCPRR